MSTLSHMSEQIGVRELRRDLSAYLRRVERGESFAVTSRGRRVAVLAPSPERLDPVERLVRERGAVPARLDVLELGSAPELTESPSLSEVLDEQRSERL